MNKNRHPEVVKIRNRIAEYLNVFRAYPDIFPRVLWYWDYKTSVKCGSYHYNILSYVKEIHDELIVMFDVTPKERLKAIYSIMNRLYVARRITMDQKAIVEALDDLDSITNAMTNDHNGEYNQYDMMLQERNAFKKFLT